ncbi:BQ2448_2018 [Microbotryum intermedium]|uniref:BQ2448_2018 protein n=1 Tax=Microbotryum intermedium TaxID=269621 RepID=A0A238FCY2_9BASI|nr:BQ2448_2018 [Microbotryum intermedium]
MNQPASETKHIKSLAYTLPDERVIHLLQDDTVGDSTGRSLWLSAQLLVLYLHLVLHKIKVLERGKDGTWKRKKAIELGAGTGTSPHCFLAPVPATRSSPRLKLEIGLSCLGLMSMYLHSQGYDVLSTDMPFIAHSCLSANFDNNPGLTSSLTVLDPSIPPPRLQSKGLDWSVPSSEWNFNDLHNVALATATTPPDPGPTKNEIENPTATDSPVDPPFDLIVLSDVVYSSTLVKPLINTLKSLSDISPLATAYVAVEVRDPELISGFLLRAKERGWKCSKVDQLILGRLMRSVGWDEAGWEGVEVWCLKRRRTFKQLKSDRSRGTRRSP